MDLSIVIVNYKSKDYLRTCIESIVAHTRSLDYQVVVVDSGSFDGCGEMLQALFPEVIFIQSESNVGFARANNLGAAAAQGGVLLFLNPDTELQAPAIEDLYLRFLSLPDVGVACCRLLNTDGSLQTSCAQPLPTVLNQIMDAEVFQRWFPNTDLWTSAARFVHTAEPVEVEAVSGACMMIHQGVFKQVGGFSTNYFMYAEDLDLCYKTRKIGLRNFYIQDPAIVHHGGGSTHRAVSNFSNVMMRESVYRFLLKTRGPLYSGSYRVGLSLAALVRMFLLLMVFPAWGARGRNAEWAAALRKWFGILRWGLGLEGWVREFDPPSKAVVGSAP
jgi:hypothetical protein